MKNKQCLLRIALFFAVIMAAAFFAAPYSSAEAGLTASHSADNYVPGSELLVTNTIEYSASLTALAYRVTLPVGWEYVSCAGNGRPDNVKPGADGVIEFTWISPPAGPLVFTYTVFVPEGETGQKEIVSEVLYRIGSGSEQRKEVLPHPLIIGRSESGPALLTASHSADNYLPGDNLEVTNIIEYTGSLTALGFQSVLPDRWSFVAAGGSDGPDISPQSGAEGKVEFAWIKPPESPITFSYTVSVPENETGGKTLVSTVLYRRSGDEFQEAVSPDPLLINAAGSGIEAVVATPLFSPGPGTYPTARTVTIGCATPGATIRYTIDGSEPTKSTGILYTAPIPIDSTTTLKAIAYKDGWSTSETARATYTINIPAPAPTASLSGYPEGVTCATGIEAIVTGLGVVSYIYRIDDGPWSGEIMKEIPIKETGLADGEHTLYLIGKNSDGVWQDEPGSVISWIVDTTPPVAEVYNAPSGIVGVSSIDLVVGGADVKYYRYKIDDGDWEGPFPVSRHITEEVLDEGDHTLYVCGRDRAGNWQDEDDAVIKTWTIDTSVPTAVLTDLPNRITGCITAAITVSGDDVEKYKYKLDDGEWSESRDVDQTIVFSSLSEGQHTLYVNAQNSAGTWQNNPTTYSWLVDTTPPDPVSGLNANPGTPASAVIRLSWTAPADTLSSVSRYHIRYSTSEITSDTWNDGIELYCDLIPKPSGNESFCVKGLTPGTTYYFALRSEDAAGNLSLISNIATATTADTLPEVKMIEPNSGPNGPDPIKITITGENFVGGKGNIIRFISNDNVFEVRSDTGIDTAISAEMPVGVPPGRYYVRVINKNGASILSDCAYTVTPAAIPLPSVTNVSPSIAGSASDTMITISGENFAGATDVTLFDGVNSIPVQFSVISEKEITATVPGGLDKGFYDIRVTTANGTNAVSAVKFRVSSPLIIDNDTADDKATTQVVTLHPDTNGYLPVRVTLETEEAEEGPAICDVQAEIKAVIEPGTQITTEGDASYSGDISPPVQVKVTEEVAAQCGSENVVVFQMGNPEERLNLSRNMLVVLTVTRDTAAGVPQIYYLESDGSLTLAGVNGTRDGQEYKRGGTVLVRREDVPEEESTTYTIGLLMDHMSTFVVGNKSTAPAPGGGDEGCFIATAAFGSPLEPHVEILRDFRDRYLLGNSIGRGIVKAYYRYSPAVAEFIARHDALRAVTRWSLAPVVGASYIMLRSSPVQRLLALFVLSGMPVCLVIIRLIGRGRGTLCHRKR